jgi:hypothetical protein
VSFSTFAQDKTNSDDLKDKMITIQMKDKSLRDILAVLTIKYDIPVGFEESTLDLEHDDYDFIVNQPYTSQREIKVVSGFTPIKKHWLSINANDERLENVLNSITGQMQNYQWEINDGVVNIFPSKGRNKKFEELLNLRIQQFTLKNPSPIFLLRTKLFALPEVNQHSKENNIYYSNSRSDFNFTDRRLGVDLDFSDLSLREILNKITKIKRGGWILKRSDIHSQEDKEFFDIQI